MENNGQGERFEMSQLNTQDHGYAVRELIYNFLAGNVHTAQVGKVISDNGDGTIDVQPLLKKSSVDQTQLECKVIPDVPNLFNVNSPLSISLSAGDLVLLVFCEECLDNFSTSGQTADTLYGKKFALGNAIAVPLLYSAASQAEIVTAPSQALATEEFVTIVCSALGISPVPSIFLTQFVKAQ